MTELILVRHGRTPWHRENRYAGHTDLGLDDTGHRQADDLAAALAALPGRERPTALACSPLRRARDTAAPVAAALGLEPEVLDELREVDFGVAEGRTLAELDPDVVAAFTGRGEPFPGAESPEAAAGRVLYTLGGLAARHAPGPVLVVGHSTALRLALCAALGLPVRRYRDLFPRLENTALTRLRLPADPARTAGLLALNAPASIEPAQPVEPDPTELVRTTRRTP
jgi:probable phosphoglycerate mutase